MFVADWAFRVCDLHEFSGLGQDQLEALLRNPNPRMRAGRMPAVDASPKDMSALIAYLGVLGTSAANTPEVHPVLLSKIHFDADRRPAITKKSVMIVTVPSNLGTSNSPTAQPVSVDTGNGKPIELAAAGQKLFLRHGCFTCHGRAGAGGLAPALAPLVTQLSDSQLKSVLEKPTDKMKAGGCRRLS
jgi:cytochrome c2